MALDLSTKFIQGLVTAMVNNFDATSELVVQLYKGIAPTPPVSFLLANHTVDQLATFTSGSLIEANTRIAFNVFPPNATASATGTAAWFAMYNAVAPTRAIIGDVSAPNGTSALWIDDINIILGNPVAIVDFSALFGAV